MIHPDYSCYTVVGDFQGVTLWEHRVVTKDRTRALVITYSPDVKRITPPVYHQHDPTADKAEGFDDCDVVTHPCVANLGLLDIFELGAMKQDHSGEADPGVKFWTMMIRRLESYPKETNGSSNDSRQDSREDSGAELYEFKASPVRDQSVVPEQDRATGHEESGNQYLRDESRPAGADGEHREEPSGTTRVIH